MVKAVYVQITVYGETNRRHINMICKEVAEFLLINLALHIITNGLYRIKEMNNNKERNGYSRNVYLVSCCMLITYYPL
jgi:hypothetical protein